MAKRKSLNRRLSRYSRSSVGSAILDPDTNDLGDERSFWWKDLEDNTLIQRSGRNSTFNQTSPCLNPDTRLEATQKAGDKWWELLDTSKASDTPKTKTDGANRNANGTDVELRGRKLITSSESEEETGIQKTKRSLRVATRRSRGSNAFVKALNESKESFMSEPPQRNKIPESVNDSTLSDRSSIGRQLRSNKNKDSSISQSLDDIVKLKPNIFKKRNVELAKNIFDDILNDDSFKSPKRKSSRFSVNDPSTTLAQEKVSTATPIAYPTGPSRFTLSFENNDQDSASYPVPKAQSTIIESTPAPKARSTVNEDTSGSVRVENKTGIETDSDTEVIKQKPKLLKRAHKSLGRNVFENLLSQREVEAESEKNQTPNDSTSEKITKTSPENLTAGFSGRSLATSDDKLFKTPMVRIPLERASVSPKTQANKTRSSIARQSNSAAPSVSKDRKSVGSNDSFEDSDRSEGSVELGRLGSRFKQKSKFLRGGRKSLGKNLFQDILEEENVTTDKNEDSVKSQINVVVEKDSAAQPITNETSVLKSNRPNDSARISESESMDISLRVSSVSRTSSTEMQIKRLSTDDMSLSQIQEEHVVETNVSTRSKKSKDSELHSSRRKTIDSSKIPEVTRKSTEAIDEDTLTPMKDPENSTKDIRKSKSIGNGTTISETGRPSQRRKTRSRATIEDPDIEAAEIEALDIESNKTENDRRSEVRETGRSSQKRKTRSRATIEDPDVETVEIEAPDIESNKTENDRRSEVRETDRSSQKRKTRSRITTEDLAPDIESNKTRNDRGSKVHETDPPTTHEIPSTMRQSTVLGRSKKSVNWDITTDERSSTRSLRVTTDKSRRSEDDGTTEKSRIDVNEPESIIDSLKDVPDDVPPDKSTTRDRRISSNKEEEAVVSRTIPRSIASNSNISEAVENGNTLKNRDKSSNKSRGRSTVISSDDSEENENEWKSRRKTLVRSKQRSIVQSSDQSDAEEEKSVTLGRGKSLSRTLKRRSTSNFRDAEKSNEIVEDGRSKSDNLQKGWSTRVSDESSDEEYPNIPEKRGRSIRPESISRIFNESLGKENREGLQNVVKNTSTPQRRSVPAVSYDTTQEISRNSNQSPITPVQPGKITTRPSSVSKPVSRSNASNVQRNIRDFFKPGTSTVESQPLFLSSEALPASQVFSDEKKMEEIKKKLEDIKNRERAVARTKTETHKTALPSKSKQTGLSSGGKSIRKQANQPTKLVKPIDKAYLVNGKVYKTPRLSRPKYWVTDRLYRHLWKCMEPKYDSETRIRSERFVLRLSETMTTIAKRKKYDSYKDELHALMKEMARLGIIVTRNDFYHFCQDFLPYELRAKVIPILLPGNERTIPYDPRKLHEPLLES